MAWLKGTGQSGDVWINLDHVLQIIKCSDGTYKFYYTSPELDTEKWRVEAAEFVRAVSK
jgi:hypothetical protein